MQRMALSQSPSNANANANSTAAAAAKTATTAAAATTANATLQQQPISESSVKTDSSTGDGVVGSKPVVPGGHKKQNPFV